MSQQIGFAVAQALLQDRSPMICAPECTNLSDKFLVIMEPSFQQVGCFVVLPNDLLLKPLYKEAVFLAVSHDPANVVATCAVKPVTRSGFFPDSHFFIYYSQSTAGW